MRAPYPGGDEGNVYCVGPLGPEDVRDGLSNTAAFSEWLHGVPDEYHRLRTAWATPRVLIEASEFVHILERRQGTRIACIEEIAYRMGFIEAQDLLKLADGYGKSEYGVYLRQCASEPREA